MSKHTPGPWTCHSGCVYADGPTVCPKGDDDGVPIARIDREPGNGTKPTERYANARLIAAAPDLLAALDPSYLREVAAHIRGMDDSADSYADSLESLADAQDAAIRKATGE